MMGKVAKQALGFVILALVFLVFVAFAITFGHAATTSKSRSNSLGVEEVYTNPNTYLFALPVDGVTMRGKNDSDLYTNIRFQPYNTMSLYTESVLFCGAVGDQFNGKRGPLVVTYETRAHKTYRGIACHELESVFEVLSQEE